MKEIEETGNVNRRQFISAAAVTTAVTIVPRHVLGGAKFVSPSEKVNIAIIGCGGQGRTNARALFQEADAQIIAIADPAEHWDLAPYYYRGTAGRMPVKMEIEKHYAEKTANHKVAEFEDFREMLDKDKAIDAVLIATPDHVHAPAAALAMRLGKHVYCEKPLTHNVWEARQIARIAKETGVATQMGNHGHSSEGIRQTCEWIWDGAIGKVKEVHAWSDAGGWVKEPGRPKDKPPVPGGFNWDLWQGPRPERSFHHAYAPYNWRGWWEYGGGCIGDMACHNLDAAVWALKLEHPLSIEGYAGAPVDNETVPPGSTYYYRFGPRGDMPPVTVTWYDGGLRPRVPDGVDANDPKQRLGDGGNGILFIGEKGYLTAAGWGGMPRLLPMELFRERKDKEVSKSIPRSKGHHADWIAACKGGPQASGNFEYSARLTEIVLLGNVALRAKKSIQWDGPNMKVTNVPEAEKFLNEEYRKGWEVA